MKQLHPKVQRLIDEVSAGRQPIIKFTHKGEFPEYDSGMKTRCIGIIDGINGDDEPLYKIETNFTEFVDYNRQFEQNNWYGENGNLVKWSETSCYPKDYKVVFYVGIGSENDFEFSEESPIFDLYKESGSNLSYVEWLEEQLGKYETN